MLIDLMEYAVPIPALDHEKVGELLASPAFLIVIGCVVVAVVIIMLTSRKKKDE